MNLSKGILEEQELDQDQQDDEDNKDDGYADPLSLPGPYSNTGRSTVECIWEINICLLFIN